LKCFDVEVSKFFQVEIVPIFCTPWCTPAGAKVDLKR
jgi:hypothetical protein